MLSNKLWNNPSLNPTQTRFSRFVRKPGLKLESDFTRALDQFKMEEKEYLSTRFTRILEERDAY